MRRRQSVLVLGGGIAGASIGRFLIQTGRCHVTIVVGVHDGSTARNQRWKHSGLLYSSQRIAKRLWAAFDGMDARYERRHVLNQGAHFLALHAETLSALHARWNEWDIESWGLLPTTLGARASSTDGVLRGSKAVGGYGAPDSILDFGAAAGALLNDAGRMGAGVLFGKLGTRLVPSDSSVAVHLDTGEVIEADLCVVAMGAWSVPFLREAGMRAPVVLRRCRTLAFEREVVSRLTVCLDARGPDHLSPDVSLAPFRGVTLAAEAEGDVIESPDEVDISGERDELLLDAYARCFPGLRRVPIVRKGVCFKLEAEADGPCSDIDFRIIGRSQEPDWSGRVLLAFPGKASLAVTMARSATEQILARLDELLLAS